MCRREKIFLHFKRKDETFIINRARRRIFYVCQLATGIGEKGKIFFLYVGLYVSNVGSTKKREYNIRASDEGSERGV